MITEPLGGLDKLAGRPMAHIELGCGPVDHRTGPIHLGHLSGIKTSQRLSLLGPDPTDQPFPLNQHPLQRIDRKFSPFKHSYTVLQRCDRNAASKPGKGDPDILPRFQPTAPASIMLISMSRLSSTAYSIGSSFTIGSMKPATIIAVASSSERPRLIR